MCRKRSLARALGMDRTIYTDPSGFDPGMSTAADGAGQGSDTSVILAAAAEAAQQLVDSVAPARVRTIAAPAAAGGPGGDAGRRGHPQLLAPPRSSAQH